jgi:hypothetical protein
MCAVVVISIMFGAVIVMVKKADKDNDRYATFHRGRSTS